MRDWTQVPPRRTPGYAVELREPDGYAVVRGTDGAARVNATALALWELCDGQTSQAEMVSAVRGLFDLDERHARLDVTAALARLHHAGLIS